MTLLGCDNPADAIRSLSLIYKKEEYEIAAIANGQWPDWLLEMSYESFIDHHFLYLMGVELKSTASYNLAYTAYYHRTLYDGRSDWFDKGLLCSEDGVVAILDKLKTHIPELESIKKQAIDNIKHRNQCEGPGGGGPYAFDTLDDAKVANQLGKDYSVPEFLLKGMGGAIQAHSLFESLTELFRRELKPVVVKFKAKSSNPEQYVINLWHYLYRDWKGEPMPNNEYYPCTFSGDGVSVSSENILDKIDL